MRRATKGGRRGAGDGGRGDGRVGEAGAFCYSGARVLNIAEGSAHHAPRKKAFHYGVARGSASECVAALTRLDRHRPSAEFHVTRRCVNMVCTMLTALIHTQERRQSPPP